MKSNIWRKQSIEVETIRFFEITVTNGRQLFCLNCQHKKYCHQGDQIIFLYLAIYRNEKLPNCILNSPQWEKMLCPSSIWRRDSNPWPLEHESSPITTRPRLLPESYTQLTNEIFISAHQRFPAVHRGHQVLQPQRVDGSNRGQDVNPERVPGRRGLDAQVRDRQDGRALLRQPRLVHRQSYPWHRRLRQEWRRVSFLPLFNQVPDG